METLQLRVTKALEDLGGKTLLATNAVPGEGKSVVALNLAEMWIRDRGTVEGPMRIRSDDSGQTMP